jgi:hypothetical protein
MTYLQILSLLVSHLVEGTIIYELHENLKTQILLHSSV